MLDTNVIISGLISPQSSPARLLEDWLAYRFELVTSESLLDELERVIERPRMRRYFDPTDAPPVIVATIRDRAIVVTPTRSVAVSRDPDDDRVIEAAVAGEAKYVVTGDVDLLTLGSFEDIEMVTPARFLEVIAEPDRG